METKLYNYLKSGLLEKDINFSNIDTQIKIENLKQNSLGLDENYLNKIINYLKIYNKFLLSQGKKEVSLRYYQILALYFSEMYFDLKKEKEMDKFSKNSLAYWMATGSGKTIVMHLNILQYLDKIKNYNTIQIIFTTPGVNLIDQHKEELEPFITYLNTKYNNKIDLIIDTTSTLLNKGSEYYSLSGNNKTKRLILIDEAHIGTSSSDEGKFYQFRNQLNKENSFLFEYSATFHNLSAGLEKEYENQIIYDYNYNLFYKDGYGKDFSFRQVGNDILAGENENELKENLDKCLQVINEKIDIWSKLKLYTYNQQLNLFGGDYKTFPDKPLITFMGNTVNNKDKKNDDPEISDISNIIKYLADLNDEEKTYFEKVFNYKTSGKLTITRNKSVEDELLLSYGDDGKYFGIINVGAGDKFFGDLNFMNIDKKSIEIIDTKYLFKNIDKKDSPINLLIGSRKFAEGWNSFRVSIIALINLGSNAGNKIIQIFGRGVRLKGLKDDGKRKHKEHEKDYFALGNSDEDKLKKLETLNILSVKKSYLETFTKKVNEEIKPTYSFKIKVSPNLIKLNSGNELNFEEYKNNLPIFKLSKKEVNYKMVILDGKNIFYTYLDNGKLIQNENITNFKFSLDFRIDKNKNGPDIKRILQEKIKNYINYIDTNKIKEYILEFCKENKLNLYSKKEKNLIDFDFNVIFNFVDEIKYDNDLGNDLTKIEKTIIIILNEFLKKLKNKMNHRINNKNIVYDKVLNQKSQTNETGDFIEEYIITKTFQTETEKLEYIANIETEKQKILKDFTINIDKHIYSPLLKEDSNLGISISPDKLNHGEKIVIEHLKNYIDTNFKGNTRYDFFLLRNVESLRSIGIYLENDEHPFFPDFVLWIIDNLDNITYINFIDPKGQDGILDRQKNDFNDKAKIGNKKIDNTLNNLSEKLTQKLNKKIILNSFIVLPFGSDLGSTNNEKIITKMIEYNVFKVDGILNNNLELKPYLDKIFKEILG